MLKLKIREQLRDPQIQSRISNVPQGVSIAQHRRSILFGLSDSILRNQETITGLTVTNATSHFLMFETGYLLLKLVGYILNLIALHQ